MYQTHYVPAYTNHVLHLILSLVTFGLWFPVWVFIWLMNHNRTVARQVWVPVAPQQAYHSPYPHPYWPQPQASPTPVPPQVP
jgi:hypothetical protein